MVARIDLLHQGNGIVELAKSSLEIKTCGLGDGGVGKVEKVGGVVLIIIIIIIIINLALCKNWGGNRC